MKFSIFFLAILLFASCTTAYDTLTDAEIERFEKIENPAERWRAHNIHNYNYYISLTCFCSISGMYRVEVRNDKVVRVLQSHSENGVLRKTLKEISGDLLQYFHTFDGYYDWFKNRNSSDETYTEFQSNSIYGYPEKFTIGAEEETDFKMLVMEFLD